MTADKRLVPEIRFRGFTDNWEQRKLSSIVNRVTRKNTGLVSDLPLTISAQDGLVDQVTYFNKRVASKNMEHYLLLLNGEFAYNKSYSKDYPWGAIKRLDMYPRGALSTLYIAFKPTSVNSEFLVAYYETSNWYKQVSERAAEGARNHGLLNIAPHDFFDTRLSIPKTDDEQRNIGLFIKKLDHTIALHQRKLAKLKELKQGYLQKLFPENGSKFPQLRFAGFADAWEQRKISDLFEVTRGRVLAATNLASSQSAENPYPVYSSQTKNDGLLGYYSDYLYQNSITWTTDGANAGTVKYRSGKFYSTNVNGVLISTQGYANAAVATILDSVAWKFVSHVGNPKLMNNVMADIEIYIPGIKEQMVISDLVNRMDNAIALHQRKLEKLQELKKGYLQKMFC